MPITLGEKRLDTRGAITISMTQFVAFLMKDGRAQMTAVRAIKKQHIDGYAVPPDLYKQFRDGLIAHHRGGLPKQQLELIASSQSDPNRRREYANLVAGYGKFLGRKQPKWFTPPRGRWEFGGLAVNVRPELGLKLDLEDASELLVVKLHLNKPGPGGESTLDKRRAETMTHLMRLAIPSAPSLLPAILDVRRGRLFRNHDEGLTPLLRGHACAFVEMYRSLEVP